MSDECRGKNTSSRHPFDADLFANPHFVRRLLATTSNLVYIYDLVGRCNVYANQDMLELLGYRKEQIGRFHSQLMATIIHAEDGEKVVQHHARFGSALDSDVFTLEYRVKAANGELRWLCSHDVVFARGEDGVPCQILGTVEDITERKAHERELTRMNHLYDMLSQLGQILASTTSREELLQKICHAAVATGGFRLAWVGWVDAATRRVLPVAKAGEAVAYLEGISVWADGRPEGRGLTGVCIRENRTNVSQDIFNDPAMIPWKDKAKAFGLRSSVAIPIRAHDQVVGSLNVYAGETDFFLEKEVVLLEEAAAHISFGLDHLKNLEERKKAEEALFEQDELLRQAIQVSQIGIFDHDHRTDTIYWSPQQRLIHGMDPDTPITLQVFIDNIHPDDLEAVSADVRRAHDPAGDGVWNVEHRIRRSDGTVRWLKGRSQTFFEGQGDARRPVRTIGAAMDVTEQKKTMEEQRKLASVIEMSSDFIGLADLDGRMVYVNAAGLNLVGLASVEECRAKVAFDFCPEVDQIRLKTEMLPTLFRTGTWTGELALRQFVTGLPIPVEMNAFIIKDPQNGQPIALANISRDLTEKNRIEEEKQKLQAQLIHAQKMESIGQLAGGIAHDFNNVLATIFGYCHILQMKMPNDDPLLVHVNQLLTSAERAARLTQSLLAFSRKQIINPEDIDLNEVVNKAEKFLTRVIPEDILLKTTLDAGALMVHADAMQIDQILLNLATNARDAMPKGGRLLLETAQTILDDEHVSKMGSGKPGPYAVLTVRDTGQGMDGQTQNRIFEPFFTTKELGKGTGLGLAIVYGIVKQNNGIINVGSEPGRGTTFKIYLPIVKPSAVIERYPEVEQPLQGGTEAILFAEDNETLRRLNTDLMEEFGYTVIEAADGEEALRLFMEHLDKIDLVILDVIMPKKNGREVFEEARQRAPSLKAIFTSGYPADLIQKEGVLETGINFLPKPSSPEALLQKIRKVLDQ